MNIISDKEADDAIGKLALLLIQRAHESLPKDGLESSLTEDWATMIALASDQVEAIPATSIREGVEKRASILLADPAMAAFLKKTLLA